MNRHIAQKLSFFLLAAALLAAFVLPAEAAFGPTINYQGKLTAPSGIAVADGTYNMRFWLLTSPSIATTSAIWTESLTGSNKVQVSNGLFSVMLGSTTPVTSVDFNRPLYLGVEIGGTSAPAWDGEMSPRKILGAVPAAFEADNAGTLGGVASTSFLRSDQADTASGLLTFQGGLVAQSSSTITNLTMLTATTTYLVVNGERFSDLTGTALTRSAGVLSVDTAALASYFATTTDFDTCSELAAILSGNTTGSCGSFVLSGSPTFTGTVQAAALTLSSMLTLSGSAANIALGSNYLSGDGGDEGVFVSSTGLVGIGTTSPSGKLHVSGTGNIFFYVESTDSNAAQIILKSDSTNRRISGRNAAGAVQSQLIFDNSGAFGFYGTTTSDLRMNITSGGNVGIGTTSPSAKLHVTNTGSSASFLVEDSASPDATPFIISASGNVGIGTTSPNTLLSVAGTSTLRTILPAGPYTGNMSTYSLGSSTTRFASAWAQYMNVGTSTWSLGQKGTRFGLFTAANGGGTERLSVTSGGNVGISTTTPSQELTVTGDLRLTGRIYDTVNSAGTNGMVLKSTGTGFTWVATSTLGISSGGLASTDIDTCSELAAIMTGETGTCGSLVLSASPTFTGTVNAAAITASGEIAAASSGSGNAFLIGDDSRLVDINVANTVGLYGVQDSTVGSIKLGSGGGTISGASGNVGIGDTTPDHKLDVAGNIGMDASSSINFGDTDGTTGYGFHDNAGTLQYKNSGGAWVNLTDTRTIIAGIYSSTSGTNISLSFAGAADSAPSFAGSTLTLPSNTVSYVVELYGAGGAGGSKNTGGATGGNSCFGTNATACTSPTLQANGGSGGGSGGGGSSTCGTGGNGANGPGSVGGVGGIGSADTSSDAGGAYGAGGGGISASAAQCTNVGTGGAGGSASGGATNQTGETGSNATGKAGGGGGAGGYTTQSFSSQTVMRYTIGAGGATGGGAGGAGGIVIYVYTAQDNGSDLAELYAVADQSIAAGEIVAFKRGMPLVVDRASKGDLRPLVGVVSTKPGITLGDQAAPQGQRPIALSGRVPTKVNLEGGLIRIGDRIALSSVPGVGKKATAFEDSIGIAIDSFGTGGHSEGTQGTVTVFIDLQQGVDMEAIGMALLHPSSPIASSTQPLDFIGSILTELSTRLGFSDLLQTATVASSSASTTATLTELGLDEPDTLWTRLTTLAQGFVDGVLTVTGVRVEYVRSDYLESQELCLTDEDGSTCVDRAQLRALLNSSTQLSPQTSEGSSSEDAYAGPNTEQDAEITDDAEVTDVGADDEGADDPDFDLGDSATSTIDNMTTDTPESIATIPPTAIPQAATSSPLGQ